MFRTIFPRAASFLSRTWREKLKDTKGQYAVAGQLFLDIGFHTPFPYYLAFYGIQAVNEKGLSTDSVQGTTSPKEPVTILEHLVFLIVGIKTITALF